jgi:hypothetical protein
MFFFILIEKDKKIPLNPNVAR